MNVTDEEIAKALNKTLKEVEEIKKDNFPEYKVLRAGVLCKKLGLNVDDLLKLHDKKVATD
jgi:hypothetical protein